MNRRKEPRSKLQISEDDLARRVRSMQTSHFRYLEMHSVKWYWKLQLPLRDLMVDPILYEVQEDGSNMKMMPLKMTDIFKSEDGRVPPTRILVEGPPFFGKTTLGCRLLEDWANHKEHMNQFNFAFLIFPECTKQDMSLKDWIIERSRVDNMEDRWFESMFANRESQMLVIVDRLDDYDDEGKRKLLPLLRHELFPKATVIALGRTGCSRMLDQFDVKSDQHRSIGRKLFSAINWMSSKCVKWTKRIYIDGFDDRAKRDFIKKYLSDVYFMEYAIAHLEHLFNDYAEPLYQCPIYLFYLTRLNEETDFAMKKSRTLFFKHLINMHAGVHDSIKKQQSEKCIDIFTHAKDASVYREVFDKFGELCWKHYLRGDTSYTFTEEELVQHCSELIFSLCFLKKELLPLKNLKDTPSYQVLQNIIVEFCIAYYLCLGRKFDKKFLEEQIEKLSISYFHSKNNRWIHLFMVGLLEKNAGIVFRVLKPLAYLYNYNFNLCVPYIQECQDHLETLFEDIKVFLPTELWIHWSQYKPVFARSDLHEKLMKYAMEHRWFKCIRWNLGMLVKLPETIEVDKLELTIDMRHLLGLKSLSGKKLICKELVILYRGHGVRVSYERFINTFLRAKTNIFRLYVHDEDLMKIAPHLDQLIQYNSTEELHIHCTLKAFPRKFSDVLKRAVEANPLNFHSFSFYLNPLIKSSHFFKINQYMINLVTELCDVTTNLRIFSVVGDIEVPFEVPLARLPSDRKWSVIGLEWLQVQPSQFPLLNKLNVEHLMWSYVPDEKRLVQMLNSCSGLKTLTCCASHLNICFDAVSSSLDTCETLHIKLDANESQFFQELGRLKHLKNLILEFQSHDCELAWEYLECLKLSRVSLLSPSRKAVESFRTSVNYKSMSFAHTEKGRKSLQESSPTATCLPYIDTFHVDSPAIYEHILDIQEMLLKNNKVFAVEVSCWLHAVDSAVVEKIYKCFDTKNFDVTASMLDMTNPSDSETVWRHLFVVRRKS